jgi:uncharacterized protein (DUF58 family)
MSFLNKYYRKLTQQIRYYNAMRIKRKNKPFSSIFAPLKALLKKRFNIWLARRIPQDSQQKIDHRNIFIMPTAFGVSFVLFTLLLFLLGTNYQNNVIILISYLLVSFFIVVLHHSFFNLSGLRFQATSSLQGFVDKKLYFPIVVTSHKARFNIRFAFTDFSAQASSSVEKNAVKRQANSITLATLNEGESNIRVPYLVRKRGEYPLGRVLVVSEYGFGLFRTWTRLDFAQKITAYPKPVAYLWSDSQKSADGEQAKDSVDSYHDSFQLGQDEFHQLQHYQLGEPFSRVAWKQVARGQGWLTKQYQKALSGKLQLDFEQLPSGTVEQRLSWLSYAIKDCSDKQVAFALKLPNQMIEYDHSSTHTIKCLTALARY